MLSRRTGVNKNKVIVFGVFDGLHKGHLSFLRQAKKYGDFLIVVVARDSAVLKLKNKKPLFNERERLKALGELKEVDSILLGDRVQGTYNIIKKIKPAVICLGHDQSLLGKDLRKKINGGLLPDVRLVKLKSHYHAKFSSSIINKANSH